MHDYPSRNDFYTVIDSTRFRDQLATHRGGRAGCELNGPDCCQKTAVVAHSLVRALYHCNRISKPFHLVESACETDNIIWH